MVMKDTKYCVLVTVFSVLSKYESNWSYVSYTGVIKLLQKFHGLKIGVRQLGYHFADLRAQGFLKSYKRFEHDNEGCIHNKSTANACTIKACMFLVSRGVTAARKHLTVLRKKYAPFQGQKSKKPAQDPGRNSCVDPKGIESEVDWFAFLKSQGAALT